MFLLLAPLRRFTTMWVPFAILLGLYVESLRLDAETFSDGSENESDMNVSMPSMFFQQYNTNFSTPSIEPEVDNELHMQNISRAAEGDGHSKQIVTLPQKIQALMAKCSFAELQSKSGVRPDNVTVAIAVIGVVALLCCLVRVRAEEGEARRSASEEEARRKPDDEGREGKARQGKGDDSLCDDEQTYWLRVLDALEHHDETVSNDGETSTCADGDIECEHDGVVCEFEEHRLERNNLYRVWLGLKQRQTPLPEDACALIIGLTRLYNDEPTLVHLDHPGPNNKLVVVGDLHGHFGDCMHIFDEYGDPSDHHNDTWFLFNGDFVDRGAWGPEVLLSLYCLKLMSPHKVHLNRGNHEDIAMNSTPKHGFLDHCMHAWPKYGHHIYSLCYRSFEVLPLCHVVRNEVFVTHGGLPLDSDVTLEEIAMINRKRTVPTKECSLCGYEKGLVVKSKRMFKTFSETGQDVVIPEGITGALLMEKKPYDQGVVVVEFEGGYGKVCVTLSGCPELEKYVEPTYRDKMHKLQARQDRVFTSLLWSDPGKVNSPSERGAGFNFDHRVAEAFVKGNNLSCVLRSHQKRPAGYSRDHETASGEMIVATVFSASNYPAGAGEHKSQTPSGNSASVMIIPYQPSGRKLFDALHPAEPWTQSYRNMTYWTGGKIAQSENLESISNSSLLPRGAHTEDPKEHALEQIRVLIYCSRGSLLRFFNTVDQKNIGKVSHSDFVTAMQTCIIHTRSFPWRHVAPYIADFDEDRMCQYVVFLGRFKNKLSARLAQHWLARTLLKTVGDKHLTTDTLKHAQAAWDKFDTAKKGVLTFQELRPLLASHSSTLSQQVEDERIFVMLSSLDKSKTGHVMRDDFCRAVAHQGAWAQMKIESKTDTRKADECWSAVEGLLNILGSNHLRAYQIFKFCDTENRSVLLREQFHAGLKILFKGSKLLSDIQEWEPLLWKLIDINGDGYISLDELLEAIIVEDTHE